MLHASWILQSDYKNHPGYGIAHNGAYRANLERSEDACHNSKPAGDRQVIQ